jgi:uncharacterized membrane protein YfcA
MMEWIAGFLIAATVGLTGIGGGSFTMPALVLLGLPPATAVGTAMVFAAVLRLVIAPVYIVRRHVHARYLGLLLAGAVPGLLLGTWALRVMDQFSGGPVVLLIVGIMLTISSTVGFVPRLRRPGFAGKNGGWLAFLALPIGMETGFSSAGAGAMGTILLLNFSELAVPEVIGTDILFGIVLAVVGSVFHLGWGSIDRVILLHLLAGGIPGALFGSLLAKRIPAHRLRMAVALIAIALGLQLVWTSGRSLFHNHAEPQRSSPAPPRPDLQKTRAEDTDIGSAIVGGPGGMNR